MKYSFILNYNTEYHVALSLMVMKIKIIKVSWKQTKYNGYSEGELLATIVIHTYYKTGKC